MQGVSNALNSYQRKVCAVIEGSLKIWCWFVSKAVP